MTDAGKISRLRYDEGCLGAHALNLIGDRWALLVVRELMFQPKRFQMIRAGLPGITASVLTQRLAQLVQAGVVSHDEVLGIYALTDQGRALHPVLTRAVPLGADDAGARSVEIHQHLGADDLDLGHGGCGPRGRIADARGLSVRP
jgi:DNA-binding HxlR family transcriptional regulator